MANDKVSIILGAQATVLKHMRASDIPETVALMAEALITAFACGGKLIVMGNGGSAVDAIHIAGEFTGRFTTERCPLPAMALTADTAALTCIANDYGYDVVFERQMRAWVKVGDVVLALSTSGKSQNVLDAVVTARTLGATVVSITGSSQNPITMNADYQIQIPSLEVARIQEATMTVCHAICQLVDDHYDSQEGA